MKSVIKKLPWAMLALTLVIAGCAGQAGQVKESVEKAAVARVLSVTGEDLPDRVRLTIDGSAPLTYTVFRLSEPLRLIVDLADTDVTQLGDKIDVSLGNVTSVVPEQFDEEAGRIGRLEIGLSELWGYETSRVDNQIIIDFIKPVAVSEPEIAPAQAAVAVTPEEPVESPSTGMPQSGAPEVVELAVPGETTTEEANVTEAVAPVSEKPALEPATVVTKVLFYEENGHFSMELVGDGSLGKYDALNLTDPARLVVDVWGVSKGFKPRVIPVEMSGVARIRVGEHAKEGKLRFVLDLEAETVPPYVFDVRDDRLIVTLGVKGPSEITVKGTPEPVEKAVEPAVEPAAEVVPTPAIEPAAEVVPTPAIEPVAEAAPVPPPVPVISDIRYRTEEGGGAVLIIADSPVAYSVSQPDSRHLIVDLDKAKLPTRLVRSKDTRDVGGPLLALSSFNPKGKNGARVSLTYEEGTQFQVEQTGITLTVVLASPATEEAAAVPQAIPQEAPQGIKGKPAEAASRSRAQAAVSQEANGASMQATEIAKGPKYTGDLMTLDFKNADVLNVLRLIAEVSGLNIITGDNVGGKISMRMVNVPWDQALNVILETKGLGQIRQGNVVRIAPLAQIEKERNAALTAKKAQEQVEDLILKIIPLSYAKAGDVVSQLTPFLGSRGSINTDARTNSLIVKDVKRNIRKIEGLVADLDIPTPQVRIEARIVIVDESWSRNLGIKWGGHAATSGGTEIFGNAGVSDASYGGGDFAVNLPASNPTSILGVSFGSVGSFTNLDLRLSVMEQANKGKIISSPTLMVIQNQEASIEVNNPFPENRTSTSVDTEGATTTTSVSFSDIWTKLKITPQVTSNDDIFMSVSVEKDSKGQQATFENNTYTGVNSHKLDTKIIVKNNGTAVIGGVYTENKQDSKSSVPFLSKVPLLGNLFKSTAKEKNKEELLIFINASIVKN
ncbi:MAG TPA: type IV pilus secretin PilQ [Proteobacteria bacterium]|nr:type IV pilus biogenesis and competence protein PilQ precursor [bacterium BMS3Abin14]HDL53622.1 type IV pilus secretin PilQ [Pseudomonadota bacterium]